VPWYFLPIILRLLFILKLDINSLLSVVLLLDLLILLVALFYYFIVHLQNSGKSIKKKNGFIYFNSILPLSAWLFFLPILEYDTVNEIIVQSADNYGVCVWIRTRISDSYIINIFLMVLGYIKWEGPAFPNFGLDRNKLKLSVINLIYYCLLCYNFASGFKYVSEHW